MFLKTISIPILTVIAFTLPFVTSPGRVPEPVTPAQSPDKPVEQVRKNIQVLKGLPDSQLFLLMNFVADSVGVSCEYCHVKGEKNPQTGEDTWLWEKDDKKQKLVGREMMRMVLDLNQQRFKREAVVSCYTCHRGSTRPERMAPLPPRDFFKDEREAQPKKPLPTVPEVVAKYVSVVGGKQNTASSPIVMKGSFESPGGSGSLEVVFKQPNKCLIKQTTTQGLTTRGTNGTEAWVQTPKGVIQITGERLAASIASVIQFNPVKTPESLNRAIVTGIARVNDRDAYVLAMENSATESTQLFFDVENGLLLRSVAVTNTMLGPLNVQRDFSDYRDVNGLKLPFVIRISDVAPFDTTFRKFSEIKIDPTIDDRIFDMPRTASQ